MPDGPRTKPPDPEFEEMRRERDRLSVPPLRPVGPQEGRAALVEVWTRHIARVERDALTEPGREAERSGHDTVGREDDLPSRARQDFPLPGSVSALEQGNPPAEDGEDTQATKGPGSSVGA